MTAVPQFHIAYMYKSHHTLEPHRRTLELSYESCCSDIPKTTASALPLCTTRKVLPIVTITVWVISKLIWREASPAVVPILLDKWNLRKRKVQKDQNKVYPK